MSNVHLPNITDYESAKKYLGSKMERPCGHNTRIEAENDIVINILYHGNKIVAYLPDSTFLYTQGWKTMTTKERLNNFIPSQFSIWQEHGQWFLSNRETHKRYIWSEGIELRGNEVYNAGSESDVENTKQLTKQIKKYVQGFINALINGEVEKPSGGDCWYCYMVTDNGKSLGDATNNTNHILDHIAEAYYVPSLLVNAVKAIPCAPFINMTVGQLLGYTDGIPSEWQIDLLNRDLTSILTRYIKRELGIAS